MHTASTSAQSSWKPVQPQQMKMHDLRARSKRKCENEVHLLGYEENVKKRHCPEVTSIRIEQTTDCGIQYMDESHRSSEHILNGPENHHTHEEPMVISSAVCPRCQAGEPGHINHILK